MAGWTRDRRAPPPADAGARAGRPAMLSDVQYLDSSPSTDGEEIKKLLNSSLEREKLDGMKHLIALISLGHDASEFFPQAVKNVVAGSVELKRLVYMYLVHYAEVRRGCRPPDSRCASTHPSPPLPGQPTNPFLNERTWGLTPALVGLPRPAACLAVAQEKQEIALLSINTFQKDLSDPNQLIRALALRVMSSIRLPITTQVVMLSVRKCAKDSSAYVRKTAAHAIPKLYSMDTDQEEALTDVIMDLVRDPSILVTGSALHAFQEVCPTRIDLLHGVFRKLCVVLPEMDEWGQVTVLDLLTRYARSQFTDPRVGGGKADSSSSSSSSSSGDDDDAYSAVQLDPDHRLLLRATIPLLQSRNSGVVVAVASLHFHLAPDRELQASGVAKALVRCSRVGREHAYVVLACIQTIAAGRPSMFRPHLKDFYVLASDSAWVARSKLEILAFVASKKNIQAILTEFRQYIQGGDPRLTAATVQAIGRCAVQVGDADVTLKSLRGLVSLLRSAQPRVVAESVLVLRNLLMGPASATGGPGSAVAAAMNSAVKAAARLLDDTERPITDPSARGCVVWMVGEFADWLPQVAPDVLRRLAKTFPEESTLVKLQTLTLAAKLTSKQTAEVVQATERCRVLAGFVFELASCDVHSDVRDRGRALRSLVGFGSSPSDRHAALLSVSKPAPAELSSFEQSPHTLGSLSYLVRREVCGFEQLPPFALEATDASLRTPDQQFASFSTEFVSPAGQGASRDRRVAPEVAASMHTSLAQFYDSSDSSEEDDDSSEDSGSSGSRSSSDSSGKYSSSSEDETAV